MRRPLAYSTPQLDAANLARATPVYGDVCTNGQHTGSTSGGVACSGNAVSTVFGGPPSLHAISAMQNARAHYHAVNANQMGDWFPYPSTMS